MSAEAFYDALSDYYDLIFTDWERSIARQAVDLDGIIREYLPATPASVLDATCGIGTQALGLAGLGHTVTGVDISKRSIDRARKEAERLGVTVDLHRGDVRELSAAVSGRFDVVISCDNSLAHLLSDADLERALTEMTDRLSPGGLCLVSVREHAAAPSEPITLLPYGVRQGRGKRYVLLQVWEWQEVEGEVYSLDFYIVEDDGSEVRARVLRTRSRALRPERIGDLMERLGLADVKVLTDRFFQPVVVGCKSGNG